MSGQSWLDEHLETFVKPVLGSIPEIPTSWQDGSDENSVWTPYQWVHLFTPRRIALLNTMWQVAKARAKKEGKPKILLPGRDAYLFEVLAKLEGFEGSIYVPELSSSVSNYRNIIPKVADFQVECYGVDSGYNGSVLKKLGISKFGLASFGGVGAGVSSQRTEHQLLPKMNSTVCGVFCADLEMCPKYWTRAEVTMDKDGLKATGLTQPKSERDEFLASAILTMHIAKHFDQKAKVEEDESPNRELMGRPYPDRQIATNPDKGCGWFFNSGWNYTGWKCAGILPSVGKGCQKPLKGYRWFYAKGFSQSTQNPQELSATGTTLCHICATKAGLTVPDADIEALPQATPYRPPQTPMVVGGGVWVPTPGIAIVGPTLSTGKGLKGFKTTIFGTGKA